MKKILLFFVLFFIGFVSVFGNTNSISDVNSSITSGTFGIGENGVTGVSLPSSSTSTSTSSSTSGGGPNDLTNPGFQINVNDISPGIKAVGNNTNERVNWLLGKIIQNLMIALGVLSVFIMTIGAGYIVLHNGQDELLSKGKSIFMAGIYAMIIALSSYLIIYIVRQILYSTSIFI